MNEGKKELAILGGVPAINEEKEISCMSSDITFEPELQRCINVDIRYVLLIIDKLAGAKHLVDEMTLISNKDQKPPADPEEVSTED